MTEYKVRGYSAKSDRVPILKAWVEIISMFIRHMPNLTRRHNYHYISRTQVHNYNGRSFVHCICVRHCLLFLFFSLLAGIEDVNMILDLAFGNSCDGHD